MGDNLGIYLDINLDATGVFDGKIGNYIYQSFPGYGGHCAAHEALKKRVCGKLNIAAGTGVVCPKGRRKPTLSFDWLKTRT